MIIKEVEVIPLEIPFTRSFKISKGYVGKPGLPGQHVYVKLVTSDGQIGWGEARPMPSWMYETMESIYVAIKKYLGPVLINKDPFQLNEIHRDLERAMAPVVSSGCPFAKSAIDIALHDLIGKYTGTPLHKLIGGKLTDHVEMSALISGDPNEVVDVSRGMRKKGYRCFKLKIMGDVEKDLELINALMEGAGDDCEIWLDANQAYSSWSVLRLLRKIEGLENVICLEQPVPTYDFHGLKRIVAKTKIPVAVDESLFSHYDLLKLLNLEALDMLVLKVAKSGIRNSLKVYHLAEAAGISCLGSGMTESGVGFAASTHLYSTLNIVAPVDTNGPQFLSDMLVRGLEIEGPLVKVPDKPGLGVEVSEERLERYRVKEFQL